MQVPKEIVESESFQSFMSIHYPATDTPWEEVENRVRNFCMEKGKDERFTLLCLGLAKYDLNGAPSNWEPQYKHEDTVFDWAEYVMMRNTKTKKSDKASNLNSPDEESEEESENDVDRIIEIYKEGFIPDCFTYLIDYFT